MWKTNFITLAMCENCGIQPKFPGFDYCGKTCGAEVAEREKLLAQTPRASASWVGQSSSPMMCKNCGCKPKFPRFDYCGKTCAADAEQTAISAAQIPRASIPSVKQTSSSSMCKNCSFQPKFPGFDYCGKTCAGEAKQKELSAAQIPLVSTPPVRQTSSSGMQSELQERNENVPSNMCEKCSVRPKSREVNEDGIEITHRFCGIICYEAAQRSTFPSSTIPTPAAASKGAEPLKLFVECSDIPIGRKILLAMEERWKSKEAGNPQLKRIYRIHLMGQVYHRFDLALQMNHGCWVQTAYYGGVTKCNITSDQEPATCESETCCLCDALRSSFGNLPYGASSSDGVYGLGLYSYTNPAVAHDAAFSRDKRRKQATQYALIQCRVITQPNPTPSSSAGFIDDSGVVFCAQPMAVIPTHLLIYRVVTPPKPRQHARSTITDPRAANHGVFSTPAPDALYNRSPESYAHIDDKDYLKSNDSPRHRSSQQYSTASLDEEDDGFDFLTTGGRLAGRKLEEEDEDF